MPNIIMLISSRQFWHRTASIRYKTFNMKIIPCIIILSISIIQSSQNETDGKILYFGYASNLLEKRIRIGNPSAERYGIGELKNYRFDLYGHNELWNGAIWTINSSHIEQLDRGEGVYTGHYRALQLPIQINTGEIVNCRVYQQVIDLMAEKTKPSKSYVDTIVKGAIESDLPKEYIARLKSTEHTDLLASESLLRLLDKL